MAEYSKTGNGAFELEISETSGSVRARRGNGDVKSFDTTRAAYDYYRSVHAFTADHAAWNICYHLEDHV